MDGCRIIKHLTLEYSGKSSLNGQVMASGIKAQSMKIKKIKNKQQAIYVFKWLVYLCIQLSNSILEF